MSGAAGNFTGEVNELLHEAARWRLAGLLFRLPRGRVNAERESLSADVRDPQLAAAVASGAAATEGEYLAWLGAGGPVSPREVSYRPLEDPGRLLAELSAYHEAFGYRTGDDEPRDHVAVAADFAGYLALKEAYAVAAGRESDTTTTREARARFVERHVGPIARGIARRLGRLEGPDYLRGAAGALCALAGVTFDPASDDESAEDAPFLRPGLREAALAGGAFDDDDGSFECGAACGGPAAGEGTGPGPQRLVKIGN